MQVRDKKLKIKTFLLFLLCLLIFSSPLLVKAQSSTVTLTVATDKQVYFGFGVIIISGSLQHNGVSSIDGLVGLQIEDSNGNTLVIRTLRTGTSTTSSLPAQISSAYLSDSSENPQSSIQAGGLGYFTVNLVNNDNVERSMLVTINLFDSAGIPIGQISEPCSLMSSQTDPAILSIPIQTWAHNGVAYGYANIYTNWPSDGGVPISLEQSFNFTITGGANSISNIYSCNANQGIYSLTFRLPAMGLAGVIYSVYVSTSYSGTTALNSASFHCYFGDFNGDGFVDSRDLFIFADSYMMYISGNPSYCTLCDMNQDGKIDSADFFLFVDCFVTYWSAVQN